VPGLTTDEVTVYEHDGPPALEEAEDQSLLHHPGHSHVLPLLDYFYLQSPKGKNLCYVTNPLTEDLRSFSGRWKYRRMPTSLLKRITQQLLLGIDYLHIGCNMVHTG